MSTEKKLKIHNSTAEFLIFSRQAGEDGIEVRVADETVWLTQKLIGVLFDKGRSTITEHLQNIFATGELEEKAVCRDFRHTAEDGKDYTTRFYNLDAIIAVGFRVNSVRAITRRSGFIPTIFNARTDVGLKPDLRNFSIWYALRTKFLQEATVRQYRIVAMEAARNVERMFNCRWCA